MLPRVLKNFNAFVEGIGYAGRIKECEPPEVEVSTDDYRGGGMDGKKKIDMGTEAMSCKMTFGEYIPEVLKRTALSDTEGTRVILKGAIRRNAEDAVSVVIEVHGSFDKATLNSWKSGEAADYEAEMNVGYYKLTIGGDRIWEIDVDNCVRVVGDNDVLASIRAAIGI